MFIVRLNEILGSMFRTSELREFIIQVVDNLFKLLCPEPILAKILFP